MEGMKRPPVDVLPDSALVPERNRVTPPPDHFTHQLSRAAPFWYHDAGTRPPDGELAAGTPVLVARRAGEHWWVIDGRGLYVEVEKEAVTERP